MPDEATPDDAQDTSPPEQTAAPGGTPASTESNDSQAQTQAEIDWEKRYGDLQPEYTRVTQEHAQLNQIIELARQGDRQAIEWLGFDPVDDEDEGDENETQPLQDPRVDALLEAEQARQYEAELDNLESHVDGEIDKLAKAANLEDLSDEEKDLIFAALVPGQDGNPDVAQAFKRVTGLRDKHIASYVAGRRRAPQAPSGSSPSHQPDLDDPEQRRQYIASRMGG